MEIDDKMVHLARNAMLVAGIEMGKEGDHWPVIKANIHALMRDYENLKIETAVQEELREHVGKVIGELEHDLTQCSAATQAKAAPHILKMRELYDAMFAPADEAVMAAAAEAAESEEETGYVPWKSSAAIIETLSEDSK